MKALVYFAPMHVIESAISKRHSLPEDDQFSSVWLEPGRSAVSFFMQSEIFADVPPSQVIINPVLVR